MKIVDKDRCINCLCVLMLLIVLYITIGTIEKRHEMLEDKLAPKTLPPPIVGLLHENEAKKKTLCICEMQSVYKSSSLLKLSLLPNKV